jgi:hypothetical protein
MARGRTGRLVPPRPDSEPGRAHRRGRTGRADLGREILSVLGAILAQSEERTAMSIYPLLSPGWE